MTMKHLLLIFLCSCLQELHSLFFTDGGDGPNASDSNSHVGNDDKSNRSKIHFPINDEFICKSQIVKIQETFSIISKASQRKEDQYKDDYTTFDWIEDTTSINDILRLLHRQGTRLARLYQIEEKKGACDKLDSGRVEFRQYRSDLMSLALCFHETGATSNAYQVYQGELRRLFKDYAFPLVNIAHIHFRQGEPSKALNALQIYFKEVQGTHVTDRDSIIFGTPCHPKALFLEDCISALNLLGLTNVNLYNHQEALAAYNQALEIGGGNNDILVIADIHENLGTLEYELGKYDLARVSFLRAFIVRNVSRVKATNAGNHILTDFVPFIQWVLLVPPISRSLEDAVKIPHAFNYTLDILETLIIHGGLGLEIDACENIRQKKTINVEDHDEEACLYMRPGHHENAELSSLQRIVLRHMRPQDILLMKNIIQSVPPLSLFTPHAVLESLHHFHIQFYGFHDRPSLERVSMLLSKVSKPLSYPASPEIHLALNNFQSYNNEKPNTTQIKRKTIVFVSCLFSGSEPHGQLVIDVIKRLPKLIFECIAVGIGSKPPGNNFLSALNGNYYASGNNRDMAAELIVSLNPECVVFVENINSPIMHFLAYERFAPIQILLMGAPITGGIPSIDYFLSGDRLEHPFRTQASGDLSHMEPYTEQVVLFDGQAISFPEHQYHPQQDSSLSAGEAMYSSYSITNSNGDHSNHIGYDDLNVPIVEKGSIYMCFQNIFKMHPIFDSVIVDVLHGDPRGHFVLQAARVNHKTNLVKERIKKVVTETTCSKIPYSNPVKKRKLENESENILSNSTKNEMDICSEAKALLSRIHFIPRVNSDQLTFLFQRATVVLHPFPFDGSKTASDVLGSGVPLVTFPQRYLRGRLASTLYATMALHEIDTGVKSTTCCIASDIGDYISKVLRLGLDTEYRNRVANAIQLRKHRIYDDQETSFEWARFLTRALGVRITDEDLSRQMDYVPQSWQKAEFHSEIILDQQRRWRRAKIEAHILSQ